MLRQLVIRDYLLVRDLALDCSDGLTVLTGETGAGKSMILGALEVLLGERFPRDAVGAAAERAVIEGLFEIRDLPRVRAALGNVDVPVDGDELLLRREISRHGRTRSWVNDSPVPLDVISVLGQTLADFHGQREHQSLFRPAQQLEYLDAFAGCASLRQRVSAFFSECAMQRRDLAMLALELQEYRKDRALLEYQLEEIERLGLKANEDQEIEARLTKLESVERLSAESARLLDMLCEVEPSLVGLAGQARSAAQGIAKTDRDLAVVADELAEIAARLKDLAGQVQHYRDGLVLDASELLRLRERSSMLWELRRKHGMTVEQILARASEMKGLLERGAELEQRHDDLARTLHQSEERLVTAARELSAARREVAPRFAAAVLGALEPLGFTHPRFEIDLKPLAEPLSAAEITAEGADRIELLFSANLDVKTAPLRDVASGGESSRVTLAVKSVLSDKADYPLLVYDELDTGISGRVADQVGQALAALAKRHQVLVITHLPQIASRADHHLLIEKAVRGGRTETRARFLKEDERVQAVAALIAGEKVTDRSRASASELLSQSGKQ